jgi:hypothetical protein
VTFRYSTIFTTAKLSLLRKCTNFFFSRGLWHIESYWIQISACFRCPYLFHTNTRAILEVEHIFFIHSVRIICLPSFELLCYFGACYVLLTLWQGNGTSIKINMLANNTRFAHLVSRRSVSALDFVHISSSSFALFAIRKFLHLQKARTERCTAVRNECTFEGIFFCDFLYLIDIDGHLSHL